MIPVIVSCDSIPATIWQQQAIIRLYC